MQHRFLHTLFFVGIVFISSNLFAQKKSLTEDDNLKFQTYFFEALKQKAIQNHSKAIENLEKCYEIDPGNKAVEFEFSKNYLELDQFSEAEFFIDKALNKDPENEFLLQHKVRIFKVQQKFTEAIEIQKRIVQNKPKLMDELVLLHIQNREFKEAEKLILEIEEKALGTRRIKRFKAYLDNRNVTELAPTIKTDSNSENKDIDALKKQFQKERTYKTLQKILNKEHEESLFDLLYADSKEGLELFPSQPYLYLMNGTALNNLKKYNDAITVLTIGIDFVIDSKTMEADFYEQLSKSHEALNNKNEALKYKQKAAALRKEN